MCPLNKRIKRELKENFGRYFALFIMFVATISLVGAFLINADAVAKTVNDCEISLKQEDGQFKVNSELTKEQKKLVEENGIYIYENFYIDHELKDEITARYFKLRTEVNLIDIMSGRLPEAPNEAVVDRVFAKCNNIKVGDTFDGFVITGMAAFAEYTSLYESNSDLLLNTKSFGVLAVTENGFEGLKGSVNYQYAYRTAEHVNSTERVELTKKEHYDLTAKITRSLIAGGAQISSVISADNNQSISFLKDDMGKDKPMMQILFCIILVIVAFAFMILTDHTVESEAVIIGTLRANGYSKHEIRKHYMLIPLFVTLFGSVIGNVTAYTLLIKPFKALYYNTYSLPNCEIGFNLQIFLFTTVLPFAIVMLINYIGISRKLSLSPLRFLRKDLKKSGNKGAVRLPNFKFITRFRIRIFFQNAGSYIVLFVGIFFASFLLIFGIGMLPIINDYVDKADDNLIAENQYILKLPVEAEGGQKMTVTALSIYNKGMGRNMEVNFYGLTEYKGKPVSYEDIIVSDVFLKKQKVKVGDEVTFENEYTEKEYKIISTEQIVYEGGFIVIMNQGRLNEMLEKGADYFNGYLSDKELDIDSDYVLKKITSYDITKMADQMLDSISGMIPMIIAASVIVYLVLMYVLTKLAIDKNALCISFMKVFGYKNNEVRKLYLHGGTFTVLASLIISIPLESIGLRAAIEAAMSKFGGYLEVNLAWYYYLEVAVIGAAVYFIINTFHVRRINKIPMTEALKNRE